MCNSIFRNVCHIAPFCRISTPVQVYSFSAPVADICPVAEQNTGARTRRFSSSKWFKCKESSDCYISPVTAAPIIAFFGWFEHFLEGF
jgi:hypothetical protein